MLKKRIVLIDYLKGYSILTIVLMHLYQLFYLPQIGHQSNIIYKVSSFGGAGVHVFILCSGLGLALSHYHHRLSVFNFIKKRFTRVYIPYIIVVALTALVPFFPVSGNRLYAVASHVFLFKMFSPTLESSLGVQFWFLSTIIQLYIVFLPLIGIRDWVARRTKDPDIFMLVGTILISAVWVSIVYLTGHSGERNWSSFFLTYLWEFCLGIILGHKIFEEKININSLNCLPLKRVIAIMIVCLIAFVYTAASDTILYMFDDPFSLGVYITLAYCIYRLNIKAFNRCILWISTFSYELFLIHILVFTIVFHYFPTISLPITIILAISFSLIIGWTYHELYTKVQVKIRICLKSLEQQY